MKNYLISLSLVCSAASLSEVHAAVQFCQTAPLLVGSKNIGSVSYYADQCDKNWENQNIRLDFSYSQKIPEWHLNVQHPISLIKILLNFLRIQY